MGKMSELEMMVKELRGYGENLIRMAEENDRDVLRIHAE